MSRVLNLVNNAIKFTEKGEIVVSVEKESKTKDKIGLRFKVRDTGIGIPEPKQRGIFDSFIQAETSTSRRYGGSGLGLAISSQLVELMGGRIWVESKIGKGSTFHFTVFFSLPKGQKRKLSLPGMKDLRNLPVLVVDNNATSRLILKEMLSNWKMKPAAVAGGKAALAAMKRAKNIGKPFELVLVDSCLTEMDGFALAEQINKSPDLTKAKIMLMSSSGVRGDAARCRQLGISAYLMKPVKQSELLNAIMEIQGATRKRKGSVSLITRHSLRESRRRLNILLAEDNIINQKLAKMVLEKQGHDVVVAKDGREALVALRKQSFDLVLMDVQMPKMDGFEATKAIRKKEKERGGHIPIVAMTALAMKGDRERCLEAGMDDYVSKPLKPEQLFKVMDQMIKKNSKSHREKSEKRGK